MNYDRGRSQFFVNSGDRLRIFHVVFSYSGEETILSVIKVLKFSLCVFLNPGFPDPGWKSFYDSASPHTEKMPEPWDVVSGLDR